MKTFLFLLLFTCLVSCDSREPTLDQKVRNLTLKYSDKLEKEKIIHRSYGFDHAGPDKIYDGKIHLIALGYSIDKNLKYQEARKLFYRIVDNYLSEVNSHPELKEAFFHFPVTYEDLHFSLSFDYQNKGHLNRDDVEQISIAFNEIFYFFSEVDGFKNDIVKKEVVPGMGTLTFTGDGKLRTIVRPLPEKQDVDTATP